MTLKELVATPQISDSGGGASTEIDAATQEATPLETSEAANAPSKRFNLREIKLDLMNYFSQKS